MKFKKRQTSRINVKKRVKKSKERKKSKQFTESFYKPTNLQFNSDLKKFTCFFIKKIIIISTGTLPNKNGYHLGIIITKLCSIETVIKI